MRVSKMLGHHGAGQALGKRWEPVTLAGTGGAEISLLPPAKSRTIPIQNWGRAAPELPFHPASLFPSSPAGVRVA